MWDAMGSPCLTFLASYSLVVAQADLPFETHAHTSVGSLLTDVFRNTPGQWGHSFPVGPPLAGEGPAPYEVSR